MSIGMILAIVVSASVLLIGGAGYHWSRLRRRARLPRSDTAGGELHPNVLPAPNPGRPGSG